MIRYRRHYPLGPRLRDLREAAGISQRETADRLRKLPSWVCRVEAGRCKVPGEILPAYAQALGVTVAFIFDEPIAKAS